MSSLNSEHALLNPHCGLSFAAELEALFFSLKGWDNIAQGNALGKRLLEQSSLKGWDNQLLHYSVPALQAGLFKNS
jgi:hypothetical protein